MGIFLLAVYGFPALVAISNLLLMRRPGVRDSGDTFCVLIPARNEAENLARLIPSLIEPNPGMKVYVFDDESDDGTGDVAARSGAIVVHPREALPPGWTGKNRACHELAKTAAEDSDADWWVYLDADVRVDAGFIPSLRDLAASSGGRCGVLTGFPRILSGRGIEPLFLFWVGWALLATNPFGLKSRLGGHQRFTNGQLHAWKPSVYTRIWPNERLKGALLEDVKIGRLLAKEGVRIEVANMSRTFGVKMYDTWRETLDGMSKNSHEITSSAIGTMSVGALLMLFSWGWLFAGPYRWICYVLLVSSGLATAGVVRARWKVGALLVPVALTIGAITIWRSLIWRRRGRLTWKGRTYPFP